MVGQTDERTGITIIHKHSSKRRKRNRKKDKLMTRKTVPLWKTYALVLRYTIIYIIIFVLFLIIPCIHSIFYGSERKIMENGNIPAVQNEISNIEEKKDSFMETKKIKDSDISAKESTLFERKVVQLEQEILDVKYKHEKVEIQMQQYDNDFNNIEKSVERMKEQFENERTLKEIMKQQLEDKIKNLEEIAKQQCENKMKTLEKSRKQREEYLVRRLSSLENKNRRSSRKYKDLEIKNQRQTEKSNKQNKENKERGFISNCVDILLTCVILILFIYIVTITWRENSREREIERSRFRGRDKRSNPSGNVPLIISFSGDCKGSHKDLAGRFIDDYDSIVINNFRDIRQIHAKVCIVFVDYNERHIILEGDREPQKIRKETVEFILKKGGIPVVIYRLHSESRNLQGRRLYSSKLSSIEYHPVLRELSSKDRVLSIDQEFSEYQISRLKDICNI